MNRGKVETVEQLTASLHHLNSVLFCFIMFMLQTLFTVRDLTSFRNELTTQPSVCRQTHAREEEKVENVGGRSKTTKWRCNVVHNYICTMCHVKRDDR